MHSISKSSIERLREQAEQFLKDGFSPQKLQHLEQIKDYIHELQVYQVELEMQADELRKTQEELTVSRDEYSGLYDRAPIGYLTMDFSGILLKVNQTFADMMQIFPENLYRKPLSQFIQQQDQSLFFTICAKAPHSERFRSAELGFIRRDATIFYGRLDITLINHHRSTPSHYRLTVVDVTEKRQAEQEKIRLETEILKFQKEDSLKRLAGGIAHNFNNLLTVIMGNLELAHEDKHIQPQTLQSLDEAYDASTKAAKLSTMMLSYLGFPPTKPQRIDVSQSLEGILGVLKSTLHGLLRLTYLPSRGPIWVTGDPTQLAQIINNLIANSVEAIGKDAGTIRVRVYEDEFSSRNLPPSVHGERIQPGHYACIEITDSGCGMNAKTLEKSIDPFFTTHFTGRGLGLSAVWGIVHAHGGYFYIESSPGEGTQVKILLPTALPQHQASLPYRPPPRQHSPTHGSILFIDDDQIVRKIGKLILEEEGYAVIEAQGGKEGVAIFREQRQEILGVILDFAMPDQDGIITLNKLRAIDANLSVLLVSGYLKEQTVDKFFNEQPNGFLQKPFSREEFLRAVAELIPGF